MAFTKEQIADFLAKKTLEFFNNEEDSINPYQKEISGGNININRNPDNPLVIYKYDIKANIEEYAAIVVNDQIGEDGNFEADISTIITADLFDAFASTYLHDPHNVGQFVEFETSQSIIDSGLAEEVLDTNIYELLPPQSSRQDQINKFFDDFDSLTDSVPLFELNEETGYYFTSSDWNDIVEFPSSPSASIARINSEAAGTVNVNQTLQSLRNHLSTYLIDVDNIPEEGTALDGRPDYDPISSGYIAFRGLNQSIIIRSETGGAIDTYEAGSPPAYLSEGFTITMWVRFLNKVNDGTLFNYGNPFRTIEPHGYKLETYILQKGVVSNPTAGLFEDTEYERFIRLVVREDADTVRCSRAYGRDDDIMGVVSIDEMKGNLDSRLYDYTHVPIDLTEWYFIVANYNPNIPEDDSYDGSYEADPDYWRWNINANGSYTDFSNLGARCKVEIISKSDLLRARGYKVEES